MSFSLYLLMIHKFLLRYISNTSMFHPFWTFRHCFRTVHYCWYRHCYTLCISLLPPQLTQHPAHNKPSVNPLLPKRKTVLYLVPLSWIWLKHSTLSLGTSGDTRIPPVKPYQSLLSFLLFRVSYLSSSLDPHRYGTFGCCLLGLLLNNNSNNIFIYLSFLILPPF